MIRGAGLSLLALAWLAGCTGGPAAAPAASARSPTPPRFRALRRILDAGLAAHVRGDARALRARSPALSREGLALIKATLPHDVARTDVPRYLEGRAAFGAALKRWVGAVESGTDREVLDAFADVEAAYRGWVDAYLGLEPETSV